MWRDGRGAKSARQLGTLTEQTSVGSIRTNDMFVKVLMSCIFHVQIVNLLIS